ncbi:T9SS type A sorting domain-containing protein [Hymenobacter edaphi]|uniref:Secretion system C-terminal sorting domain-containing protein n=1 Tax=Hymenobacter edaphi TaxID=2211146 RepID=A0A328BTE2_9BACT|nr:T9SS type A sorting domain-containing protein [Hymenobacter edaphi]RAK70333.1 hypothetical protein DLM85_05675 [Hymenobacter edaphi]
MSKYLPARAAWLPALFLWLLAGGQAVAQRVGPPWEQSIRLPAPVTQSFFIWLRPTAGGYVATGNAQASPNFPHLLARYDTAGNVVWQRRGRVMISGEQDVQPWGGGWVFVGSRHGPPVNGQINPQPFLQKIRATGDTLPGITYRDAASAGFLPSCVLPDRRGFTLAGYALERIAGSGITPQRMQVMRTDTAGAVRWQATYNSLTSYGNAVGTDILARPGGGYLLTGTTQYRQVAAHPTLLLLDSLGRERRRRMVILKDSISKELYNRLWGRTLELPNGEGYVLNCRVDVQAPNRPTGTTDSEAWVVAVDTALNVLWRTRLPNGRSSLIIGLRVYRQADGTLLAATYDEFGGNRPEAQYSPYLYVHRLSATGQWLSRRQLPAAAGTPYLRAYDWQPVAGDSVAVVCGSAPAGGLTPNAAWIARLRATTPRQVTAARGATGLGALVVYPNPAAGATAQVVLPPGLGRGATLTLRDALGRTIRVFPVVAGQTEVAVPLASLPAGLYTCSLLLEGRPVATQKLSVTH